MEILRLAFEHRWIAAGAAAILVFGFFAWILPYTGQFLVTPSNPQKADAIVVLGSALLPDHTQSSDSLRRTIQAITLQKKGYADNIIVSGGGWPVTAGEKMAELAKEMGVEPNVIFIDEDAESTFENGMNARRICDRNGWQTVLLVTSSWHSLRGRLVFERLGFTVYNAPVPYYEKHGGLLSAHLDMVEALSYEFAKLAYYRLKGWV